MALEGNSERTLISRFELANQDINIQPKFYTEEEYLTLFQDRLDGTATEGLPDLMSDDPFINKNITGLDKSVVFKNLNTYTEAVTAKGTLMPAAVQTADDGSFYSMQPIVDSLSVVYVNEDLRSTIGLLETFPATFNDLLTEVGQILQYNADNGTSIIPMVLDNKAVWEVCNSLLVPFMARLGGPAWFKAAVAGSPYPDAGSDPAGFRCTRRPPSLHCRGLCHEQQPVRRIT